MIVIIQNSVFFITVEATMIAVTSFLILMFSRTRVHHDIMPSSYHNVLYSLAATVASRIVHIWVKLEGMDKVLKITLLGLFL